MHHLLEIQARLLILAVIIGWYVGNRYLLLYLIKTHNLFYMRKDAEDPSWFIAVPSSLVSALIVAWVILG